MTTPWRLAALRAWWDSGVVPGYCYRAIEARAGRIAAGRTLGARLPNGCRMACDPRDEVQRGIWFFGVYEPLSAYLFARLARPGMVVVDGGANVGQYTLLASTAVGPSGSVHAFEPVPENFARLEAHVRDNGLANVRLNRAALWRGEATLTFGLSERFVGTNAGGYRARGQTEADTRAYANRVEVPAVALDDYAERAGLGRMDLIKLDVEGAEGVALAGARRSIERWRPTLLMEVTEHAEALSGTSAAREWPWLSGLGYGAWRVGFDPARRGPVESLDGLGTANLILHCGDRPEVLDAPPDRRLVARWARAGRRAARPATG